MPEISICIPAYNADSTISETLDSVWAQSFEDFEVILVDDHSSDRTLDVVAGHRDSRLKVHTHARNVGVAMTTNHAVSLASGHLIKFLDNDDLIAPDALRELREPFTSHSEVTIAFCRRRAFLDETADAVSQSWLERYERLHTRFADLAALNSGRALLDEWLAAGAYGNWIGEPVCVMARRDAVVRAGGENPRIRQNNDMALWTKLLLLGDVAFVDAELAFYRIRRSSLTRSNGLGNRGWLDLAWILQDLWTLGDLRESEPLLRTARRDALTFVLMQFTRLCLSPGSVRRAGELRELARDVVASST